MTRLLDLTNSAAISRCPTTAPAGTVLRILCGIYFHYGIADGRGGVIHAMKKRGVVHDKSLKRFERGGVAEIYDRIASGDMYAAYLKAYSAIGRPYKLFSDNCEHLVRWAHGMKKECPQLHRVAISGPTAAVAIKSKNPEIRTVAFCVSVGSILSEKPIEGALAGFLIGLAAIAVAKSA